MKFLDLGRRRNVQPALQPNARHHVGVLVHSALNQLWGLTPDAKPDLGDPDEDRFRGCCTRCCAPCQTLFELLKAGCLDQWVMFWPTGLDAFWWNSTTNTVDRGFLDRAWANEDAIGCHDGED